MAWLYHVQLSVAVIRRHLQVCSQLHAQGLEEVEDGQLNGPQLHSFLSSCVLDVRPASLLRGEDTGSMETCTSKGTVSAGDPTLEILTSTLISYPRQNLSLLRAVLEEDPGTTTDAPCTISLPAPAALTLVGPSFICTPHSGTS